MEHRIEVALAEGVFDARAADLLDSIRDLGVTTVRRVRLVRVYLLSGELNETALRLASTVLADPVIDVCAADAPVLDESGAAVVVQVAKKAGVMDPVALTVSKALNEAGVRAAAVRTAVKYLLFGNPSQAETALLIRKVLANEVIEEVRIGGEPLGIPPQPPAYEFSLTTVPLLEEDDEGLERISRQGMLSLSLEEMREVRAYFAREGRPPTDCELETFAQTWSEHCVHKTFRGLIRYREAGAGEPEMVDDLLKSTIMRATEEIAAPWCVLVFRDNAGIIEFDERFNLCFKVETHNHPSAIEPYGGAATGIGGVIRDPLGTGLGALPIANTDVFCFGPPEMPHERVPEGCLHPKRVMKGVVAGVRDYGNRMGIPTVNGAVLFDERYVGNPLVYCGNLGLIPREKSFKAPRVGDAVVLVGGRTGRDGIHGVTFASLELTSDSEQVSGGAVQIGNPVVEKALVDVLIRARDEGLYTAVTDCGGGGLSSAVGEMGAELGVEVDLERVPLKYSGLSYTEIWISEAQERMVLAVPPENLERLLSLFAAEDVEATVIGRFTGEKRLRLNYEGRRVADIDMEFLHGGVPRVVREAVWEPPDLAEPEIPERRDYTPVLLKMLGAHNVCSKEWVVRQYDHEVQARTVVKPLVGPRTDGPADGAVLLPRLDSTRGVTLTCGICPRYADIDPYWMAAAAIDEAVRNAVCLGADPDRIALLDNFSWGRVARPEILGALVRACRACYDFATAYKTPFISGKDSLNNEFVADGRVITVPHTLLVSALGVVPDVRRSVTSDLKAGESFLYILGATRAELGGSEYHHLHGETGASVPKTDARAARDIYLRLHAAVGDGLVLAAHDCSEGGLAVAAAEMAFGGGAGLEVSLAEVPFDGKRRDDFVLFSESTGRILAQVAADAAAEFERLMSGTTHAQIGRTIAAPVFRVTGLDGRVVIEEAPANLRAAWKSTLMW